MEIFNLNVESRTTVGKGPARALRREGKIPAVLYGPKSEPVMLTVNSRALETVLKKGPGGQSLMRLKIENGDQTQRTVMLKELQVHPLSREMIHADFYEIDMNRKIRVNVPVITSGKSIGVEMGGLLQIIRRELEVLCLPMEIPESIEINTTDLDIGDSVHVEEVVLPEGVEIPAEVNFTVVTVLSPKKEVVEEVVEEELEEGEEGVEAEAAEPAEEGEAE